MWVPDSHGHMQPAPRPPPGTCCSRGAPPEDGKRVGLHLPSGSGHSRGLCTRVSSPAGWVERVRCFHLLLRLVMTVLVVALGAQCTSHTCDQCHSGCVVPAIPPPRPSCLVTDPTTHPWPSCVNTQPRVKESPVRESLYALSCVHTFSVFGVFTPPRPKPRAATDLLASMALAFPGRPRGVSQMGSFSLQ